MYLRSVLITNKLILLLFVQRTYGPWKELAPSQKCPIMPQNAGGIRSEDYISNYNNNNKNYKLFMILYTFSTVI